MLFACFAYVLLFNSNFCFTFHSFPLRGILGAAPRPVEQGTPPHGQPGQESSTPKRKSPDSTSPATKRIRTQSQNEEAPAKKAEEASSSFEALATLQNQISKSISMDLKGSLRECIAKFEGELSVRLANAMQPFMDKETQVREDHKKTVAEKEAVITALHAENKRLQEENRVLLDEKKGQIEALQEQLVSKKKDFDKLKTSVKEFAALSQAEKTELEKKLVAQKERAALAQNYAATLEKDLFELRAQLGRSSPASGESPAQESPSLRKLYDALDSFS